MAFKVKSGWFVSDSGDPTLLDSVSFDKTSKETFRDSDDGSGFSTAGLNSLLNNPAEALSGVDVF